MKYAPKRGSQREKPASVKIHHLGPTPEQRQTVDLQVDSGSKATQLVRCLAPIQSQEDVTEMRQLDFSLPKQI